MPPKNGMAEKVIVPPVQIVLDGEAVIATDGLTEDTTLMLTVLELTVGFDTQPSVEVMVQLTASLLVTVLLV